MTLETLRRTGELTGDEDFVGRWVHDWQRYIPDEMQALWHLLSDEARGAVMAVAQGVADNEEWD